MTPLVALRLTLIMAAGVFLGILLDAVIGSTVLELVKSKQIAFNAPTGEPLQSEGSHL